MKFNRTFLFRTNFFVLSFFPMVLTAQLNDSFADGDFTDGPEWTGNTGSFLVNPDYRLQLNSNGEGTSFLSTSFSSIGLAEWRIWVNLAFSPSDNNNARIYLVADQSGINEPLNGYFLKLGESGSADAIELFRQSGTATYLVCRGEDGFLAAPFTIRLRVVRSPAGIWNVYADPTGGEDFQLQATGEDPTWENCNFFGFSCKYTSSNATRFYFDDVYAGPLLFDDIRPLLLSAEISDSSEVSLFFSEPVNDVSASDIENYSVDQGIEHPMSAVRDQLSSSMVRLLFLQPLNQGTVYNITVRNVTDLAGNIMETVTLPFAIYHIQPFDVVINEIMADPDPPAGLPDFEYLELYNAGDLPVQLENWELSIGTVKKKLTQAILESHSYLILASDQAVAGLSEFGTVMGFPSLSLANSGTVLTLREANGAIIHTVNYTDDWYQNSIKQNGGWSLEQIDPKNPCQGAENWRASNKPTGGSPGSVNSINGLNPDESEPFIEKVSISGASVVRVFFSEPMDSLSLANPLAYSVDPALGNPAGVSLHPPDYGSVSLFFSGEINEGIVYTLILETGFTDCAGNGNISQLNARFAIPSSIDSNDIVINEVLYDPRTTGTDFVEIYNRSEKVLDLKELWLAGRDATTGELESLKETSYDGRLMFPGEYITLSADTRTVLSEYFSPVPNNFIEMAAFPSFPNEEGTVVILSSSMQIVDEFSYNPDLQFALLNTTDGVSLERVNFENPANASGNWHSASQNAGFATPGYQNSQFMQSPDNGDEIVVAPEIFSPDNDGYNDILSIACSFKDPGYAVTIRIFDSNGHQIRLLVRNEPAGTSNRFTWDGITEDREKAPIGIYIIYIEVFNLSGKVKQFKKAAVLGGKL
ncbi:MAG: lamin tail domain-containing protein [Bacteroidota bacterium]